VCAVAYRLRLWVRSRVRIDEESWESRWGMLLTIPVSGYPETPEGPLPHRQVEWVELSTLRIKGGMAGRPREMIDSASAVFEGMPATGAWWNVVDNTWTVGSIVADEPVRVVRVANPFFSPRS
jgi:hypothetical protein